ncbi:MAG: MFS transporter [Clostridia bacterium]|nr:MFS transporter [Clostridia bacterium]
MSEKSGAFGKVKDFMTEVKTHWNTPKEGNYVPYKEYKDIFIAVGSNYAGSKMLEYISFGVGCFLIMHHYELPYLTYAIISLINMPLNYIGSLISWYVSDNLGFLPKKSERKVYATYFAFAIAGLTLLFWDPVTCMDINSSFVRFFNTLNGMSATAFFKIVGTHLLYTGWTGARNIFWRKKLIPKFGRYKYSLYCDFVPKSVMVILIGWLPLYNIPDMATRVWAANLLFACYNVFGFANNLETCTKSISPNTRERILVRTYPIKLSHLFHSIIAIIIPVIIGALKDEWADINVFRFVIPGMFITFATLTMFFAGRVQERIPQPPIEKKVQISFWDGMFGVLRNKYLWINTLVGLLDSLGNGMLAFTTVLYLYTFRLSGLPYSLIVALVSFAGTPPDFFTPYFIKRFSYKQIMIFYQLSRALGYTAIALALNFFGDNLVLCGTICVVVLIFMEATSTVPKSAAHDMNVRITDYQMYLSGERLENYSGVYSNAGIFSWFTGPITSFVGLIIPLILLTAGFNGNWDVLFIDSARFSIIIVPLIIEIVGYFLMTIPFMFWDYDSSKQEQVMQVLQRRAEVTEGLAKKEEQAVTVNAGKGD